jgi:hypothetical protein
MGPSNDGSAAVTHCEPATMHAGDDGEKAQMHAVRVWLKCGWEDVAEVRTPRLVRPEEQEGTQAHPAPEPHCSAWSCCLCNRDWQQHCPRPHRLHRPEGQQLQRISGGACEPGLAISRVEYLKSPACRSPVACTCSPTEAACR